MWFSTWEPEQEYSASLPARPERSAFIPLTARACCWNWQGAFALLTAFKIKCFLLKDCRRRSIYRRRLILLSPIKSGDLVLKLVCLNTSAMRVGDFLSRTES